MSNQSGKSYCLSLITSSPSPEGVYVRTSDQPLHEGVSFLSILRKYWGARIRFFRQKAFNSPSNMITSRPSVWRILNRLMGCSIRDHLRCFARLLYLSILNTKDTWSPICRANRVMFVNSYIFISVLLSKCIGSPFDAPFADSLITVIS